MKYQARHHDSQGLKTLLDKCSSKVHLRMLIIYTLGCVLDDTVEDNRDIIDMLRDVYKDILDVIINDKCIYNPLSVGSDLTIRGAWSYPITVIVTTIPLHY